MEGQTQLLVVDKETDEELCRRQLTCTEEMAHRGLPPAHNPWEPKPDWACSGSLGSDTGQKVWWAMSVGTMSLSQNYHHCFLITIFPLVTSISLHFLLGLFLYGSDHLQQQFRPLFPLLEVPTAKEL